MAIGWREACEAIALVLTVVKTIIYDDIYDDEGDDGKGLWFLIQLLVHTQEGRRGHSFISQDALVP